MLEIIQYDKDNAKLFSDVLTALELIASDLLYAYGKH